METLIFDLDDTIIPSSYLYKISLEQIKGLDHELYLKARHEVKLSIPESTQKHSRLLYFKRYIELSEDKFNPTKLLELNQDYESKLKSNLTEWVRNNPAGFNALRAFAQKGHRCIVATNENLATQTLKIEAIDPRAEIFEGFLCSEEAGCEKPEFRFYEQLIHRFNINPSSSYFIGDDFNNDVKCPQNFGFKTVWQKQFLKKHSFESFSGNSILSLEELCTIIN